ncbi:MAG: hypothetical protein CSA03_03750 [Bacteroidetes bacterium]|nr:MAG: hypothetical protein CSA03_03750 [Bacteroidota bacterium]
MKKNLSFLVVALLLSVQCWSQNRAIDSNLSPSQLQEDFEILVKSLRENHPGLYDFAPKSEFDSLAALYQRAFSDSMKPSAFHVLVRKFVANIGCGHTTARPSQAWYAHVKENPKQIPMHVIVEGDQLYVKKIFSSNVSEWKGYKILSIDGRSSSDILFDFKSITEHDGVGTVMVIRSVERLFQTYYTFLYGSKDIYTVELEKENRESIELVLKGKAALPYQVDWPIDMAVDLGINHANFGILHEPTEIAVIDMSSFPREGYKKFYRELFKELAVHDSIPLVIDLRGNGGGYFPTGNLLLRYLMDEEFTMDFQKPRHFTKRNKHLSMDFASKMTRFMFTTIPDRNKQDPDRNYQIKYKPIKKNHFDGDIYVLTDGLTFSTGSFVASKLKERRGAIVIGEETGGGAVGFNAVLSWSLTLPNSGVRMNLPLYHVDVLPEQKDDGRGVMPNISVESDIEQRVFDVDVVLQKVLEIIQSESFKDI